MIYLDNGATTFPKPQNVLRACDNAQRYYSANPGRGGHKLAMKASEIVYHSRSNIASFFGLDDPSKVVFTINCTTALNTVIKGIVKPSEHILISSYEHNAVLRPVEKLSKIGISYSVVPIYENDDEKTLNSFRENIRQNTRLVVCTIASNVFGIKLPVERICALCHQYGIITCVDAAQGAGLFDIDLSDSSIDFLCLAGHKGLYGPMGTGAMLVNCDFLPDSLIEGGTGSNSSQYSQPEIIPDKFESGTPNFSGIAGLSAGVDFVRSRGVYNIYQKEIKLVQRLYEQLNDIKGVRLYTEYPEEGGYAPVLSFNLEGYNSEALSEILSSKYNIATRAGLHCAPLAHKSKGTIEFGTVRVVPSVFTTQNDINRLVSSLKNLK